jgi:hypothetical protein
MGSFKRSLFGYRRPEVDAALSACHEQVSGMQAQLNQKLAAIDEYERETASLSGMVRPRSAP